MHWSTYISLSLVSLTSASDNFVPDPAPGAPAAVLAEQAEQRLFGRVWKPKQLTPFQIVLSATVDTNKSAGPVLPEQFPVFDVDLFDNTKETITQLKRSGRKVICYFSAGTSEDWRDDFKQLKAKDIGAPLPAWPGEKWLDIRSRDVYTLMKKRIRYASQKGCDALDPDNMDGYDNENGGGFKPELTKRDTIRYMRRLSRYAHLYGMSIGLKNSLDTLPALERNIEFAVNEECATEEEACEEYRKFLNPRRGKGKPVFHIEYVTRTPVYAKMATLDGNEPKKDNKPQVPGKPTSWKISGVGPPGLFNRNQTQAQIRSTLCAVQNKNIGSKMSTVIKVMSLDGWIMDCSGKVWVTRGKTIEKGHDYPKSRLVNGAIPRPVRMPDPEWLSILGKDHKDDQIDHEWETAFDAAIDRELEAMGFDNTSKKKGAAKDRRAPTQQQLDDVILE